MTTVVYSSGPVTPWMWNVPPSSSRQNPRSAHSRAVSTRMSIASAGEEVVVAGGADVLAQRVGDVGVDVVLRGAGRVVGRRLLAVDGAPREERAALGQLVGAAPRGVEQRVAEPQRVPRRPRDRVGEERHHVDLGVPEVVAAVAGAGHALRRRCPGPRRGRRPGRARRGSSAPPAAAPGWPAISTSERAQKSSSHSRCSAYWCVDALLVGAVEGALAAVDQLARRDRCARCGS